LGNEKLDFEKMKPVESKKPTNMCNVEAEPAYAYRTRKQGRYDERPGDSGEEIVISSSDESPQMTVKPKCKSTNKAKQSAPKAAKKVKSYVKAPKTGIEMEVDAETPVSQQRQK
jgi:hypothetical protein